MVPEWMVSDMRIDEAIKFAEHAQTMTDIPEVKEFYAMAEKALRTQNQVNWMSVKDRLPDENNVIVGGKCGTCSDLVIVFVRDALGNSFTCDDMIANGGWINYPTPEFEVTHWMPLPEPPEREGE